jgi:serine phosphatase RsbU (regulator of sigma subunit)
VAEDAAEAVTAVFEPGEARDLAQQLNAGSVAVVPLLGRGRTVGLLSVFRDRDQPALTPGELDTLLEVAGRAGLALDNARLYAGQRDVAEILQRSMMTAPPEPDQVEVAVRYVSAAEAAQVGGDWYDAFVQDAGVTMVAIGDVVGHDTEAAAAMNQVRSLLRAIAVHTGDGPADVLRGVDRAMTRLQPDTTATAVIARFEQTAEEREAGVTRVRWSNAGHPPPMIVVTPDPTAADDRDWRLGERPDDAVDALWSDRFDLLLGLDPETPRTETVVTLHPGATVWLYTDGLVERRGQSLDEGLGKLRGVLDYLGHEGLDLEEACEELLRRMLPERPEDDVALVAVRLRGSSR